MARWRTKFVATFSLNRNSPTSTRAPTSPTPPSLVTCGQKTVDTGLPHAEPIQSTSSPPAGPESTPAESVNLTHTSTQRSICHRLILRWRTKVVTAIARKSIVPVHSVAHHIGPAMLVSGLTATAPLHAVSPLAAAIESAPDDDVDLGQAKSALRVLAALGDGVTGVPWLKGAAKLGLEIVNSLDVSALRTGYSVAQVLILFLGTGK